MPPKYEHLLDTSIIDINTTPTERRIINIQVIMSSTGIAVGLNRGYPVTKRVVGARPSHAKAVS
jgi:hypothetical protein